MDELDRELGAYADSLRPDHQPSLGDLIDRARDRRRSRAALALSALCVVAVVSVTAAVLGGGAPAHPTPLPLGSPSITSTPTVEPIYACGQVRISGIVDYTNFVKANGQVMSSADTFGLRVTVRQADLGQATDRVSCSLEEETHGTGSTEHINNGTSSFLPEGTTLSEVNGFDPRCRIAAVQNGKLVAFLASLPNATTNQPAPCAVMPRVPFDSTEQTAGDYRGAPEAYQQRTPLPDCGSAATVNVVTPQLRAAVDCFTSARGRGQQAEFRTAVASDVIANGFVDITYSVFRTGAGGRVDLWQSGLTAGEGSTVYWRHQTCTGVSHDGLGEGCVAS